MRDNYHLMFVDELTCDIVPKHPPGAGSRCGQPAEFSHIYEDHSGVEFACWEHLDALSACPCAKPLIRHLEAERDSC